MSKQRHDVAVLGGGLIGSAMALALGQHGFSVVLIDPAPVDVRADPAFDGRAYAIAPGSRNLLDTLGIWDAVDPEAQPIRWIGVEDRCGGPVPPAALRFDPAEAGAESLGWIVEDRVLRGALLRAVEDRREIRTIALARAEAVVRGVPMAEVQLSTGEHLGVSLVVACDGRRSRTARGAGIQYLNWGYDQTGLVAAIEHDRPHEGLAHQSFFPGGPFAVLPLQGNRSSLVWSERSVRAREISRLGDDAYMAEIAARIGGRLGKIRLAGRRWAYPLDLALAQSYAAPRLVVAGDAAHGVHPIAGQGMNMGLRDVAALVQVLVEGARLGLDPGDSTVLAQYQRWRRPDATMMALGMDGLNKVFSNGFGPLQVMRNLGLRAVARMGDLRRGVMAEAAGQAGEVPALLSGKPI